MDRHIGRLPAPRGTATSLEWLDLTGLDQFYVGNLIRRKGHGRYEPETFAMMCALIETADGPPCLLDVGANIGIFSATMAGIFGRALGVYAFEPMPELAAFIRSVARRNDLAIDIQQLALGDCDGRATLYVSSKSDASNSLNPEFRDHKNALEVEVRRLDTLFADGATRSFVLKIDTETTEPEVLAGGQSFIGRHRPAIICEVLAGYTEERLAAFFGGIGYHAVQLNSDPDWRAAQELKGDPNNLHRDWVFLPEPARPWLRAAFTRWRKAFTSAGHLLRVPAQDATRSTEPSD